MKLLDKIKDLFMDEVLDEDELELEEEEKEEYKAPAKNELPKVMRETISREEKRESKNANLDVVKEDRKEESTNKKFNFPVDFDTDLVDDKKREPVKEKKWDMSEDFLRENNHSNINVLQLEKETSRRVSELYANKKTEDKSVKPKFKASPVISPVYGILDKNYKKDEVKEKTDDVTMMKRPSKKVDFETVRKKAFGNLVDDIKDNMLCENCELYKEVKKISALKEDDLLYEMTVDDEDKDVTIEKAYDDYEEFGVAYEPSADRNKHVEEAPIINDNNGVEEEPTFTSIKAKIETEEEVEVINNVSVVPEEKSEEEVKEKKIPSRSEEKKDSKVDDDFFELIDSMYKERADE